MTNEELLALVKLNLRRTDNDFDNEINSLINEAEDDISKSCDTDYNPDNLDENRMVVLYVKGLFGEGDPDCWNLYQDRLKAIKFRKLGGD